MVDFMDKLAEFVCGTVPMLYETKTLQNVGEFAYFVSQTRGISKKAPIQCKCSRCQSYDLIRRFGHHCYTNEL